MKKLLFITAMLVAFASNTFAQYLLTNSTETRNFIRVYGGFNYASVKETVNGSSVSFNPLGATVGGVFSPNLTFNTLKRMPLFLEVGGEFTYLYGKPKQTISVQDEVGQWHGLQPIGDTSVELLNEDGTERPSQTQDCGEIVLNSISFSIPVNVSYCFDIKNGKYAIAPYAGVNLKFNLLSQLTVNGEKYGKLKAEQANHFQFGVNLGVNVILVHGFTVGYRFQPDIMHYAVNTTTSAHSLQLGYRF